MNNEGQSNRPPGNRCGDSLRTLLLFQALQGRKHSRGRNNFLPLFLAMQGNQSNPLLLFLLLDRGKRRTNKVGYQSDHDEYPAYRQSGGRGGKRESKTSKTANQQEPSHTA